MKSGIYCIRCTVNGKLYIGSTSNFKQRWKTHRVQLRGGRHHNVHLQRAWKICGESQFRFIVLMHCERHELFKWERAFINKYKPHLRNVGYNCTKEVNPNKFRRLSAIHRKRISASSIGKHHTEETKQKIKRLFNRPHYHGNKKYIVTKPDGTQLCVIGLRWFCRNNPTLNHNGVRGSIWKGSGHYKGWHFKELKVIPPNGELAGSDRRECVSAPSNLELWPTI